MEVKGCTLEIGGVGYFPDAPTERGVKHLNELSDAIGEGYKSVLAFVIQMEGVTEVFPNAKTHPEFADALENAKSQNNKDIIHTVSSCSGGTISYSSHISPTSCSRISSMVTMPITVPSLSLTAHMWVRDWVISSNSVSMGLDPSTSMALRISLERGMALGAGWVS